MSGNRPDYDVTICKRGEKNRARIGAAWVNRAGGINIKFAHGILIQTSEDVDVTLWPPRDNAQQAQGARGDDAAIVGAFKKAAEPAQAIFDEDDNIPF